MNNITDVGQWTAHIAHMAWFMAVSEKGLFFTQVEATAAHTTAWSKSSFLNYYVWYRPLIEADILEPFLDICLILQYSEEQN